MVSQDFIGDKLLKAVTEAGVIKINASGTDPDSIRIEVYHNKNKDPIIREVPRQHWYGDVVDSFEQEAESVGFKPAEIMEINKDIANIIYEMTDVIIRHREKQTEEEVRLRKQQLQAAGIIAAGPQGPHVEGGAAIETESQLIEYVDWSKPQSVKTCLQAKPGTVYTVYGNITAKGKLHHKIKGAQYRCSNCNLINYQHLARPADIGDTDVPTTLQGEMCRFCARNNYSPNSAEYRNARTWHLFNPDVVNCVEIELTDTDRFDEVDTLKVVLLGRDAEDVRVGEHISIRGKHQTMQLSRRGRKSYPICFAYNITYKNQEVYQLTNTDVKRVKRFVELAVKERPIIKIKTKNADDKEIEVVKLGEPLGSRNIIRRLVWMTGHHVIDCEDAKEAVLYTETSVGVGPDVIGKGSNKIARQRIHTGLVGGPGSSKTTVSLIPLLHDERNDFENAQSSSMKTLTAIVSKEGGDNSMPVLRIGKVAQTKGAVLTLNEFAEVSLDDQKYVQDSKEEGQFTVNKQGIHAQIKADTAFVWTGNPKQGADFAKENSVDLDEIAVRKQNIDRTDLLVVMRPIKDPTKREVFNRKVLDMQQDFKDPIKRKIIRNYDEYVKRHILYARTLNPKMTVEARNMIAQAEARIQEVKFKDGIANAGSNRALGTLERLATVIAKLKLHHDEITTEDASDAIDFYNKISAQIHQSVDKPQDIADYTVQTMVFILQNESNDLSVQFKRLAELAAEKDPAIRWYLYQGVRNKLGDVSVNKNLRRVLELLENISANKIKRVKQQPAEFLWVGSSCSSSEGRNKDITEQESKEGLHADPADPADQPSPGLHESKQTKLPIDNDKYDNQKAVQPESSRSGRSARSASTIVQDDREYKILMAMEMARAKYNSEKVQGRESGSLISPQDVWGNLMTSLPDEDWRIDKVIEVIEEQIAKGRVLKRQGDAEGRYYFIWHYPNGNSGDIKGE